MLDRSEEFCYPIQARSRGGPKGTDEGADRTLKTIQRRETRKKEGTARAPRTHSVSRTAHGIDSEDSEEFRYARAERRAGI